MDRFQDLYARMAASTSSMGRTSSQDGDQPQVSSKSLKFIYEPKHCRQDEEFNQRVNDALKQYKAEIHKTLEPRTDSGLVSRSDSSSLINTGKDTASARDQQMITVKQSLNYDYITSKEDLHSGLRIPADAESTRSQKIFTNLNAQVEQLKQSRLSLAARNEEKGDGKKEPLSFLKIKAKVDESTATEVSMQEMSFNGQNHSVRHPAGALNPVLMNYSRNVTSHFPSGMPEPVSEESKHIEDYDDNTIEQTIRSTTMTAKAHNLDLIEEQMHQQRQTLQTEMALSKDRDRSQTQNSAICSQSVRSRERSERPNSISHQVSRKHAQTCHSKDSSHSVGSFLKQKPPARSATPKEVTSVEKASRRTRSNAETRRSVNFKEDNPVSPQRRSCSPNSRIVPSKSMSSEKQSIVSPKMVSLRNPPDLSNRQFSQSTKSLSSLRSSSAEKQKQKARANSPIKPKIDSEIKSKLTLNQDKLNLQRMLEDMSRSVQNIQTKYNPSALDSERLKVRQRQKHQQYIDDSEEQSMQHSEQQQLRMIQKKQQQVHVYEYEDLSVPDIARAEDSFHHRPSRFVKDPSETTFKPNETGRETVDSNFVRKYEERSLEAIRTSKAIIKRHQARRMQRGEEDENSPQPLRMMQREKELLSARYMEPSDVRPERSEDKSNMSNLRNKRSRSKSPDELGISWEKEQLLRDQSRLADLLSMNQKKIEVSNPTNSRARHEVEHQTQSPLRSKSIPRTRSDIPAIPLHMSKDPKRDSHGVLDDAQLLTERVLSAAHKLDLGASYATIDRHLEKLRAKPELRDNEREPSRERTTEAMVLRQSRRIDSASSESPLDHRRSTQINLANVQQDYNFNETQTTCRQEPTFRSNLTQGIETYCKKAALQNQPSERDLNDIRQKSEQLVREMSEARDLRYLKNPESIPLVQELKSQNDIFKIQNAQMQQELTYYKDYSKEKQTECFKAQKRADELELELSEANNAQLFQMYKTLKAEHMETESQLKSKNFNFDQQSHAMTTLLEQYEKLKESQLSLLAMNKQLLVNHQKEVLELQESNQTLKSELRAKNEKITTYQEILRTFNGQISEFEEYQQHSQRDMTLLNDQYRLYRDLYDKESAQKKILVEQLKKLQKRLDSKGNKTRVHANGHTSSGFRSHLPNEVKLAEQRELEALLSTADRCARVSDHQVSKKHKRHSQRTSSGEHSEISYLSSPDASLRPSGQTSIATNCQRQQQTSTIVVSSSPEADPTFRRRSKKKRTKSSSISPLRNPEPKPTHASKRSKSRGEHSRSKSITAKTQQDGKSNQLKKSSEELGLRSNFAKGRPSNHRKSKDSFQMTTLPDEELSTSEFRQPTGSEVVDDQLGNTPKRLETRSGKSSSRYPRSGRSSTSRAQDFPPLERDVQMNVNTQQRDVTYLDQDQCHEFDHGRMERSEMQNQDQKLDISPRKAIRSPRFQSAQGHHKDYIETLKQRANNQTVQYDIVSMSSIERGIEGKKQSSKGRTIHTLPTEINDMDSSLTGAVPWMPSMTNHQIFGNELSHNEHQRRRSSSMQRPVKPQHNDDKQKHIVSQSGSKDRKSTQKLNPLSTKEYYHRLRLMQQRLDRARVELMETSDPNLSPRNGYLTRNHPYEHYETPQYQMERKRVMKTADGKYKVVQTGHSKKHLQTTAKFASQRSKRQSSRSLSMQPSGETNNGAIRTAIAGGSARNYQAQ